MLKVDIVRMLAGAGGYLPEILPVAASQDVKERLIWSNFSEETDDPGWARVKRAVGVIGAFVACIAVPGWVGFALAAPAYYAGTFLPDIYLNIECEKARGAIDKELPAFAENLAILAAAGLSLGLALPEAAAEAPGVLGALLAKVVNEISLGTPRRIALADSASGTPSKDFQRLVDLIIDTERFGTPVAAELTRMACELREKRMAALREEAQKLPVKMLFPLVFMILPAFILLTAGPMLVSMTK